MKTINLKTLNYVSPISQFPILFFLFVMAVCPTLGQHVPSKSLLQPKDYAIWHTLRFPQISGDGRWTSYQLDYEQAQDSLFVLDMEGNKKYQFPDANMGQFEPNKKPTLFVFKDKNKGVGILNLLKGITIWDNKADRYEYSKGGRYLACYSPKRKDGYLKLIDIKKNESITVEGVQNFKFDPSGKRAVLITNDSDKTKVELLNLDKLQKATITSSINSNFLFPTFNDTGDALVFMENAANEKQRIYYFENSETPILKELDNVDLKSLGEMEISQFDLSFSMDGERIFFWTHKIEDGITEENQDAVKVQVWKGTDKWIYPRQKFDWEFNKKDWKAVWWPKAKKVFQIANEELPETILTGDQKFAITYNILTYEPQYKQIPQSDFYITNLETGERKLFVEQLESAWGYLTVSPNGDYVAYFKDKKWWIYNIEKSEHIHASNGIPFQLNYKHPPHSVDDTPYGFAGWTTNNELLIYDEFDVWKINQDGKLPKCLTNGRAFGTSFRPYNNLYEGFSSDVPPLEKVYNLAKDNIFITRDSLFNYGYTLRKANGIIQPMLNETGKISELRKAKYAYSYIYLKEKNDTPPAIWKMIGKEKKILWQSNPQQFKFNMGKTELIPFENREGEKLHGLLHYPDNYIAGKQYPVIVHVYELFSNQFQNFSNPGLYNDDGFNYRNYTAAGYFVFEPDILIQKGNPGISTTDCVLTSVNKVLEKGIIKSDAIGIVGHSFGGYETAYLISQTNLFKAAVVGAGVYDIVSSYHTVGQDYGRSKLYLYENQQWQIGTSFYENREGYYNNSPLHHGANIKTPTLIWAGNEDYHVDWHQSEQMYLALRRLKVDVEMLIYENEIHALMQPKNKKDLTERIHSWFDKYLKK
ncbi:prolyl oligopeptidase family serine peptidase [Winogradskyella sp.]|uniref:S9 family peptidase n=1 Tax=Winogradskyella sp. TaxID=1883156 RepID=UPI003AB1C066